MPEVKLTLKVISQASLDLLIDLLKEQIEFVFDNLDQYEGNAKDRLLNLRSARGELLLYREKFYGVKCNHGS